MENATKALMIAAGVLIAMVIIGALLLMFNSLSDYQKSETQNEREQQIIEFNSQYEAFIGKNIRGSDLYSLLNKVVDYNRRKSSAGTGKNDDGQYIGYEPIKIEFEIGRGNLNKFYADNDTEHLIKKEKYIQSGTSNEFKEIETAVSTIEGKYGQEELNKLITAKEKIFISDRSSEAEKKMAVETFNNISKNKKINKYDEINETSNIRKDIYKYYEYIQFKRARFDCVDGSVKYSNTGRIVEMKFKFNGKFN